MACLIDENWREVADLSAQVSAVIGPTPGTVLNLRQPFLQQWISLAAN